jgi:hypothetical protein
LSNCIKSADAAYGWYNPLRYRARHQAKKFYLLLQLFGGPAWEIAHKKYSGGKNKNGV